MKKNTPIYFKSYINLDELQIDNLYTVGSNIKYKHSKYKKFDLIIKLPVFKLDKYSINDFKFIDPNNNAIDLKLFISQEQKFGSFGTMINSIIKTFSNNLNLNTFYPNLNLSETKYIKIKQMEKFNYPIFNVDTSNKLNKPIVKMNSPNSLSDLKNLIKSDYEILPFVQMKLTKFNNKCYLTLVPVKFYVGKNLSDYVINQIIKNRDYSNLDSGPNVPHFNCNECGHIIDSNDFNRYLEEASENNTNTNG